MGDEFTYHDGWLYAEDVAIEDLARDHGTPLYVYSKNHLESQFAILRKALQEIDPLICFAVKSNTSAGIINVFAHLGAGADIVSAGELYRSKRAGIPPSQMVFAGVGKTEKEIEYALREEILSFTVESEPELERINDCAGRLGRTGRIDIRMNPDVDPKTHKYTSTGKRENKFGIDLERAALAYQQAASLPHLEVAGLHMHIGSPVMSVQPYREALEKVVPFCRELKKNYPTFRHLDIGGGVGIPYSPEQKPFAMEEYAKTVIEAVDGLGLKILLEPGRFLTGNGGILVTQVQYLKSNPFKKFVVIDAAINDLIRPAFYEAYHHVLPVRETRDTRFGDLVGPICESGDFLAQERDLPAVDPGEYLAVLGAGAYGFSMASQYNSRGRPAEILISGNQAEVIRERETWDDLVRGEHIPAWTNGNG